MKNQTVPTVIIGRLIKNGYYEKFDLIEEKKIKDVRQDGKFLLCLLKIGFNPIDIDQMLDIRSITIERRILNYLKELEASEETYKYYKFIFENVNGLPDIDIYRRYINCQLGDKKFIMVEAITKEKLTRIKEALKTKGMSKYEYELRQKNTNFGEGEPVRCSPRRRSFHGYSSIKLS